MGSSASWRRLRQGWPMRVGRYPPQESLPHPCFPSSSLCASIRPHTPSGHVACKLGGGRSPGSQTARATSAARKDLLHGLGELLPLVSRKQERERERAWENIALPSPWLCPLGLHGDREALRRGTEMGPGPASLQLKMPPHLAELSLPQSHKDRTAAPVQDTDGAWTPASNEGWPWSRS